MTIKERTERQNNVLQKGLSLQNIIVWRVDGEYMAQNDAYETGLYPTVGEAVEEVIWRLVDRQAAYLDAIEEKETKDEPFLVMLG